MKKLHFIKLSLAASVLASGTAIANEDTESKIANLESQMAALREDVKSNNLDTLSKLHMAGYANVDAIAGSDRQEDGFTAARFAPIFHFQFSDRVLFEGELEIETNADGETEIAAEYATIDLMLNDYMALVAGKFLSPIGQFRQNVHPSWINKLPTAPVGFGHGGAAPLSDLGVQLRGGIPLSGSMRANYALFTSNGPTLVVDADPGEEVEIELETEAAASNGDGALDWLVGAFYSSTERVYDQSLPTPGYDAFTDATLGEGTSAAVANGFEADSPYNAYLPYDLKQLAVFGEVNYQVNDDFKMTVGSRFYDYEEERQFISGGLFANGDNQTDSTESDGFTSRVIGQYSVNENVNLNAQVSQGFRLGGVNDPLNRSLCTDQDEAIFGSFQDYDDEKLTNYEIGMKSSGRGW